MGIMSSLRVLVGRGVARESSKNNRRFGKRRAADGCKAALPGSSRGQRGVCGRMAKYMWIGLGGALGAISRYVLGVWVYKRLGTGFPYGTFVINMSGCFLIGLIVTILDFRTGMS